MTRTLLRLTLMWLEILRKGRKLVRGGEVDPSINCRNKKERTGEISQNRFTI